MLAPVGERAIAAGILTAAAFRNGDPAACTLLPRAIEQLMAQAVGAPPLSQWDTEEFCFRNH